MYSKTITYTDFNGTERTETFYFHLSKPELLSLSTDKANQTDLNNFEFFKYIILQSYGIKSEDGRQFIKNDELRNEFEQTEAFSVIFTELAFDSEEAIKFIRGIVPGELVDMLNDDDIKSADPDKIVEILTGNKAKQ